MACGKRPEEVYTSASFWEHVDCPSCLSSKVEDESFRQRVCRWLEANGVDPNKTPMQADASIADGRLTIRQKVTLPGTNGGLVDQLDPENPNEILTEVITVPVLVEPDKEVAEWLRPKCLACGR